MNTKEKKPANPTEILAVLGNMDSAQLANIVDVGNNILQERQLDVLLTLFNACKVEALCIIPKPKDTQHFDVIIDETSVEKIQAVVQIAITVLTEGDIPYSVNISKFVGENIDATISIVMSHPTLNKMHEDMLDTDIIEITDTINMIEHVREVKNAETT